MIALKHEKLEDSRDLSNTTVNKVNLINSCADQNMRLSNETVHKKKTLNASSKISKIIQNLYSSHSDANTIRPKTNKPMKEYTIEDKPGIPSNVDLFVIGWAKAHDKKTDRYYYYTLDRSQVIWEYPISNIR